MSDESLRFFRAASVADVPEASCITVRVAGVWCALAEHEGAYYAVANKCPHNGAPLGMGQMDCEWIICPYHGWAFSVKNGTWDNDRERKIPIYPVRLEGDEIWIGFMPGEILDAGSEAKIYPSIWDPGTKPTSGHSDSCC